MIRLSDLPIQHRECTLLNIWKWSFSQIKKYELKFRTNQLITIEKYSFYQQILPIIWVPASFSAEFLFMLPNLQFFVKCLVNHCLSFCPFLFAIVLSVHQCTTFYYSFVIFTLLLQLCFYCHNIGIHELNLLNNELTYYRIGEVYNTPTNLHFRIFVSHYKDKPVPFFYILLS